MEPFLVFLIIELPILFLVYIGVVLREKVKKAPRHEPISVIVTCYSEGKDILKTARTLSRQKYGAPIQVILVIDDGGTNTETTEAAYLAKRLYSSPTREIQVAKRLTRGGRVGALNTGLLLVRYGITLAVDGDTSFDEFMLVNMLKSFAKQPPVVGVCGSLRVRNVKSSLATRMQDIEYLLGIVLGRLGLSTFNIMPNISGAFGAFKTKELRAVGGWTTHTAEDLDLTLRLKQYYTREGWKLAMGEGSKGYTDVPVSFTDLIKQRMRWDGDLFFMYIRKHGRSIKPSTVGWGNFAFITLYSIIVQILLPFVIVAYLLVLLYTFNLGVLIPVYLVYLSLSTVSYLIVLATLKEALHNPFWLLAFPFYQLFMKIVTVAAILYEVFARGHMETAMSPRHILEAAKLK